MHSAKVLYHWFDTVAKTFNGFTRPQAKSLAAFSLGVANSQSCTLNRVAQGLCSLGKTDTVERRLQRFLSNPRINWQTGSQNLSRWVLSHVSMGKKEPLVLLVDETALAEHLKTMAVSLAYHGRALPLAWWCYPQEHYPMSQVKLIDTLLSWVAPFIPSGREVVVEADRGIGTSPGLLRAIEMRGWHYLVRVQGTVALLLEGQKSHVSFKSLLQRPGQSWAGWVWAFKKAGWRRAWAIACWEPKHPGPWLLLSDRPGLEGKLYSRRMWEEMAFRDFKSNGWQWQKSRVWDPDHANRLWLVMALAYVWTLSLGTRVREKIQCWREVTRGAKKRISLFKLGLRWLVHCLQGKAALLYQPHLNCSLQP